MVVKYYQLAHNFRHPENGKPTAKILHNFGRADRVDRDQLIRLCRSIAKICGVLVVDPQDEADLEQARQKISEFSSES